MIILTLFLLIYFFYIYKITKWLNKALTKDIPKLVQIDPSLPAKYKPFERTDRENWPIFQMYFCAIFLLPIRIILTIFFTFCYYLVIKFATKNSSSNIPISPFQRSLIKLGGAIFARAILLCAGFYWISKKEKKIKKYLKTYPYRDSKKVAPIIVSNHVSWLDIFYFISSEYCPSYLSKKDVESYFLIGTIAKGLQSLFISRDDKDDKNSVINLIIQRCFDIKAGKKYPQLLIFPEGTTTNGNYLISFKKGAFFTITPTQIVCLKYNNKNFSLAYDAIDSYAIFFVFLQLKNNLKAYHFDVFDPDYLKLDPTKEKDWFIYAQTIKKVMAAALDVDESSSDFNEKIEYYKNLRSK